MLSILIPVYNHPIHKLVSGLHNQCTQAHIEFEILVAEDGSNQFVPENSKTCQLANVKHYIYKTNSGRSAIRNKLADASQYPYLLFIDCDAGLHTDNYILSYLPHCNPDCIVIGGTAYDPLENNPDYSLRLKYGRTREASDANNRSNNLTTFNFLIAKSIFNHFRFDETIKGYGHEDMLFGHQLHQAGYTFTHINNSLLHLGLDSNTTFLNKTSEASKNLYHLHASGRYPFLCKESNLLKHYLLTQKIHITSFISRIFAATEPAIRKQLSSPRPSLLLYDLFKLATICQTSQTK